MPHAESFLTSQEKQAINRAVAEAETRTSGEIVPVVATDSGRYDRAEGLGGLLFAVVALAASWLLFQRITPVEGDWVQGQSLRLGLWPIVGIVVVGFVLGTFLTSQLHWLRRAFATERQMQQEVLRGAWEAFARFRVSRTQAGTGILIYISLFERMVCVLGDDPIAAKLDQKTWDEIKDIVLDGVRGGRAGEALCTAVNRCGELLSEHFPIHPGDTNELSNKLRFLD